MSRLAENLASVKARIAKASNSAIASTKQVRLVAVSKTRAAEDVRRAYELGQIDFGENYLQEALDKIIALKDVNEIQWHFIGPVQSNKTRPIAENFHWVQSVDRLKIAERLSEQRPLHLQPLNLCIQINLDQEQSKSGIRFEEAADLAEAISLLPNLVLRGLMYIPAPQANLQLQRQSCEKAFAEFNSLQQKFPTLDTLSLGMSSDLEAAISAGSNMVRIGTDIFGPRPNR